MVSKKQNNQQELTSAKTVDKRSEVSMTSMNITVLHTSHSCVVTVTSYLVYCQPFNYTCTTTRKKIPCETCRQKFSFQGQLDQHKIVHRTINTHQCMAKGCGCWFMRKADLIVHAETHNKKEYKCNLCPSFMTFLCKYWKEHMKGHSSVLPYACSKCGKRFLYCQQVSRHKGKDHKE